MASYSQHPNINPSNHSPSHLSIRFDSIVTSGLHVRLRAQGERVMQIILVRVPVRPKTKLLFGITPSLSLRHNVPRFIFCVFPLASFLSGVVARA